MDCIAIRNLLGFNGFQKLMDWKDNAKSTIYRVGKEVLQKSQQHPKLAIGSFVVVALAATAAFGTIKAIYVVALPIILMTAILYSNSSKTKPKDRNESEITNNKRVVGKVRLILEKWTFFKTYLYKSKQVHPTFDPFVTACQEIEKNLKELQPILNEEDQKKIQELIASAEKLRKDYGKDKKNSAFKEQLEALYKQAEDACNQMYTHY